VHWVRGKVHDHAGLLLDAACGPGTYGRRIAGEGRTVYGIDISMGTLRRGDAYLRSEGNSHMHIARAQLAGLPFRKAQFDATICCGALHLFEDTTEALKEIGCTMKEGATLAVMTFTTGNGGVLRHRWVREHVEADHGAHIFELPELEGYLNKAGFTGFDPGFNGSVLLFSARKGAEQSSL
jgi:ubiquinone/menaquinone biosynthesis C-methylase UbiE